MWTKMKKSMIVLYWVGAYLLGGNLFGQAFDVQYGLDKTSAELDQAGLYLLVYCLFGAIFWYSWNAVFPKTKHNQ